MCTNVAALNVTAAGVISGGPTVLAGVVLRNTDGTNAGVFRIFDNASAASGTVLFTANLAAKEHVHFVFPGSGVQATKGLFLDVSAGTVEGSVQIA